MIYLCNYIRWHPVPAFSAGHNNILPVCCSEHVLRCKKVKIFKLINKFQKFRNPSSIVFLCLTYILHVNTRRNAFVNYA